MSDLARLRTWLARAAPQPYDLIKACLMATIASLAGTGLFVGAMALLVVSAQRPGLRAIAIFLVAIELVAFLRSPLRFGERMSTHRLGFGAVAHWRQWLMTTVGNWNYSRWQHYGTGDLLERSLTDTEELQDLWLRGVIPIVATTATMVASDLVVGFLAPTGRWWGVALGTLAVQCIFVVIVMSRLGPQVRADREVRERRGAYVSAMVATRAAAPEIDRLGASDFLRQRDVEVIGHLRSAEDAQRRVNQRDVTVVMFGPLAALAVLITLHPRSANVWILVAALVAVTTFDALVTVRSSVRVAVAVTGGAERLDDLSTSLPSPLAPWPSDTTMTYRDVSVIGSHHGSQRISGTIAPGRRVAINGPSGAGKSTLLRTLARLDDVTDETINIGDVALQDIDEGDLRSHVVLVPSEPGLVRGYVRDVVGMGISLSDMDMNALAKVGLEVDRNDQWTELSRGERQRVAIVRALARRPSILLLDEPTSALGEVERRAVLDVLSSSSATMIIATHDIEVMKWCDEVVTLIDPSTVQPLSAPIDDAG